MMRTDSTYRLLFRFLPMLAVLALGCGESYDKGPAMRRADKAMATEQFDEAIGALREVVDHDPEDVDALFKLGLAYALQNSPHRAWIQFHQVLSLDSTRVDAIEQLGMLAYAADEREEAIAFLEKAVEMGEDKPHIYDTLAYLHFQEGTIGSAKKWMRKAIQSNPRDPRFRYKLARYHHFIGEDEKALPLLERLARDYPTYWDGKLLLGRVYRRLGEETKALEVLDEAIPNGVKHPDHYYEHGMARLKTGDPEGAIKSFEASIVLKPEKPEPRYGIGQAYLKMGDREKARAALDRFREVEAADKEFKDKQDQFIASWQEGLLNEQAGDSLAALAAYEAALRLKEVDVSTSLLIWMIRRGLDDPIAAARARTEVERALAAEKVTFETVAITLAKRLSSRGFHDKAVDVLKEALADDPSNLSIRHQLIRTYDRMGKTAERAEQYRILRSHS